MATTSELLTTAIEHVDNNIITRAALPIAAHNLIMNAYNVLIDMQEDGLSVEDADEQITEALDAITDYVNRADTPESVGESIWTICKPVNELMHHLNYVQAYGE
ncbi:hypothetical protein AB0G15_05845 [Streptosporangium sp. NPDC023825]|uniref:hypothetical protein n=1 Tax=Streptosporangium sp. NPDC023825 TaxID=3154909 RepID=UPI00342BA952